MPNDDKQSKSNFQKRLFLWSLIILAPIVGLVLGPLIGIVHGVMSSNGSLERWQSLGSPPGQVAKLLGICDDEVCIESKQGKVYRAGWRRCSQPNQICWYSKANGEDFEPPVYNPCWLQFNVATPPSEVVETIETKDCSSGGVWQTNYVLLSDGTVWEWSHVASDLELLRIFAEAVTDTFVGVIVGIIISALVAVTTFKELED